MKTRMIITCLLALFTGWTVAAAPVKDKHVTAELIPEVSAIAPGQPFWVALKLDHEEHWHTYWINDGDSGLPTKIRWTLPEGFTNGPIVWPAPRRIPMPPLMSFGYEGSAWLLTEIIPPAVITSATVAIKANASWLMCKEVCIPGKAAFTLTLPVAEAPRLDPEQQAAFTEARRLVPATETDWTFSATTSATTVTVIAQAPAGAPDLGSITLFALEKGILASAAEPVVERENGRYRITLVRDVSEDPLPEQLGLVVVATPTLARDPSRPAVEVQIPFGTATTAAEAATTSPDVPVHFALVMLFAFAGGLILNLMPCVFPVISLKILGFVQQAGEDPKAVWRHGLVFTAGVVVSFWILAGVLIALRATGAGIGWGFQLQSPAALVVLSLVFFTLALNLFGVFEVGLSLTAAGGQAASRQGWAGSFFSGFLATVIATPCTAPFMGVALGYALTQPPAVSMLVFTSLALGMSFPYLVLSRYPSLLKRLPRPGPWMETMKQVMGFLIVATVIWLFWVLAALVNSTTLTALLAAFLLAGVAAWIYGKWDTFTAPAGTRWRARFATLVFAAAAIYTGLANIERAGSAAETVGDWQAFSPERLAELQSEGRPVFIDFTAKWCLSCQVNKLTVLRTAEIMQAFRDKNVALLVADWTDENEMIAAELARHGRQSVPLYLLYDGKNASPVILPELLTKKIVTDALTSLP